MRWIIEMVRGQGQGQGRGQGQATLEMDHSTAPRIPPHQSPIREERLTIHRLRG